MIYYRHCTGANGEVKPLLFCYQSSWQRDLLKKYGGSCLLDATYKTTTYDIPLFFIAVKSNVGYLVVGFFFIQIENARSIHEALDIFKDWNKDWNPLYWVTDFSESEINAIEQAFPQTKVYLCLFHRKQAWGRWLKKKDNLRVPNDMKTFLDMWQEISESPTEREFRDRVAELRTHEVSRRNERAWPYFQQQWLTVCERWVKAYEDKGRFATIDTTNGVEAMNKIVKHFFLKHNSDRTLTGVTKVIINQFLPNLIRKYCLQNSAIKAYNKDVPLFLHKKTNKFAKHVMQRYASAKVELTARSVSRRSDGSFCVESAKSKNCNYVVNFDIPDCTCEDFRRYKYPCKHFCAIFIFYPEWGFDKMPESYKTSPLICLDEMYGVGFRSGSSVISNEGSSSDEAVEEAVEAAEEAVKVEEAVEAANTDGVVQTQNIPLQQFEARELCKQIYNLTYNCSNSETLQKVLESLSNCVQDLQLSNPEVGGLPLAVPSTSKQ
ncbi:uncharacterized protein LOC126213055 isoform X2 [Schistocerca nitens]|uniref:uncharacterized protein LOC126213055 isoform X2 n=1 Tax=Schistocerca nitens TaxID=7011 RepID=UPI0021195298|nr:uncharacterized protein LOC126213055 isoform X2 [Schistocerca nitens]